MNFLEQSARSLLLAAMLAGELAACQPENALKVNITPTPTPADPGLKTDETPTPGLSFRQTPNPHPADSLGSVSIRIFATGQAARTEGKSDTFVPVAPFTKEIFAQTRKSVLQINFLGSAGNLGVAASCSGFIIDKTDTTLLVVTAAHCLQYNDTDLVIQEATFWQPGADTEPKDATKFEIFKHPTRDQAILKITTGEKLPDWYTPIPYKNNSTLQPDTHLLAMGFPGDLYYAWNSSTVYGHNGMLLASVTTTSGSINEKNEIDADGITADVGSSGGPVIVLDHDTAEAVGVIVNMGVTTDIFGNLISVQNGISLLDIGEILKDSEGNGH